MQFNHQMGPFMHNQFAWRLQVEIWDNRDPTGKLAEGEDETGARPYLALIVPDKEQYGGSYERLAGLIEYDPAGWQKREGRWLARFYPKDAEGLEAQEDEGESNRKWRSWHRVNHSLLLKQGELRYPRDHVKDALGILLEQVQGEIPQPTFAALLRTGSLFLPTLQQMTNAWLNKNRPAGVQRAAP